MSFPRPPAAPPGRPSGIRIVRELPLALEPVTRDPFIDGPDSGPVAAGSQRKDS